MRLSDQVRRTGKFSNTSLTTLYGNSKQMYGYTYIKYYKVLFHNNNGLLSYISTSPKMTCVCMEMQIRNFTKFRLFPTHLHTVYCNFSHSDTKHCAISMIHFQANSFQQITIYFYVLTYYHSLLIVTDSILQQGNFRQ